ncbi:MAG TPA: hypothetical protein VJ876_01695, partial [Bacteroidales bacterium]|nr:hypothetical protein [Bacteroidales bacterium]
MAKIKYRFDPNTLTYKKIYSSTRKKIIRAFSFLLVTVSSAFIFHLVITTYFSTPMEIQLKREKQELVWKYEMLNR